MSQREKVESKPGSWPLTHFWAEFPNPTPWFLFSEPPYLEPEVIECMRGPRGLMFAAKQPRSGLPLRRTFVYVYCAVKCGRRLQRRTGELPKRTTRRRQRWPAPHRTSWRWFDGSKRLCDEAETQQLLLLQQKPGGRSTSLHWRANSPLALHIFFPPVLDSNIYTLSLKKPVSS